MSEVRREEPISPTSPAGLYRSSLALLHIFKKRRAPKICFVTFMLVVITYFVFTFHGGHAYIGEPVFSGCLKLYQMLEPEVDEYKDWLLHPLVALSGARTTLIGTMLLVLGYCYEYEIGALVFLGLFLLFHFLLCFLFLYFHLIPCFSSLEYTLVAFAPLFHVQNPVMRSDGAKEYLRVTFAIEPRWHFWILIFVLMVTRDDSSWTSSTIAMYYISLSLGFLYVLRQPSLWRKISMDLLWIKQLFFLVTLAFLPISTSELFSWEGYSLLQIASAGLINPEAFYLMKATICATPLLVFAVIHAPMLTRAVYATASVLLIMNSMNLPNWYYPGPGFFALIILTIAFCR